MASDAPDFAPFQFSTRELPERDRNSCHGAWKTPLPRHAAAPTAWARQVIAAIKLKTQGLSTLTLFDGA
jgi:hypothetical protein